HALGGAAAGRGDYLPLARLALRRGHWRGAAAARDGPVYDDLRGARRRRRHRRRPPPAARVANPSPPSPTRGEGEDEDREHGLRPTPLPPGEGDAEYCERRRAGGEGDITDRRPRSAGSR